MNFIVTASNVLLMMAYAIPGFAFIKVKALNESHINAFSKFLLYVCQPAMTVYSLTRVECTAELACNMGIFLLVCLVLQAVVMLLFTLVLGKRMKSAAYRVAAVSSVFGNVGFIGIPLLEALLPQYPQAVAYSATFSIAMNLMAWTLGLRLLTGEKKYISFKSVFANPAMISFLLSLPLFIFNLRFPPLIASAVELVGRMSTVVCMTVLGMRLALVKPKKLFCDKCAYLAASVKLVIFPLCAFAVTYFLPLEPAFKAALFVMCCCPSAALIQSLSEIYGGDRSVSADTVLITNILCIVTIPLLCLLLG